ncbi:hypothetical protein NUACC21_51580 [Scytonema sp. NUACC21]
MVPNNNFGLPDNNTFLNDGLSVPSPFTDPLIGNQNYNQDNKNTLTGAPSTDIVQPDSSNGAVSDRELLTDDATNNPLLIEKTSTINTYVDPLTGNHLNEPLVNTLKSGDALLSHVESLQGSGVGESQEQVFSKGANQLSLEILERFRVEAHARWSKLGVNEFDTGILNNIELAIEDLPGYKLGLVDAYKVIIDTDAAGQGWFIDSTPEDDVEFSRVVSARELEATEGDLAYGKVDLLTILTHEFGHVLGLEHVESSVQPNDVMSPTLPLGIRRTPVLENLNFSYGVEPVRDAATLSLPTISPTNNTIGGNLSTTDALNPTRNNRRKDDYLLTDFTVGKLVTLNLSSSNFDAYLQLVNADTQVVITEDDDSGGYRNSRIRFTPVAGVNYIVRVTSDGSNATGDYNLTATFGAPELIVTSAIAPTTGAERSSISLTWTVSNIGEVTTNGSWYDYVYLSDNTIFDNSDRYVGNVYTSNKTPLAPGTSYTITTNMSLPQQVGAGKQYLLFVADRDNYEIEVSEVNNVKWVPIEITVPDLAVTNATAPLAITVGSSADISWTVENQGSVQATHSWYDRIYISDDQIVDSSDTYVSNFNSGASGTAVEASGSYTLTKTVTIPQTALGNRYLLFVADYNNSQYETNENNNVKAIRVEVNAPDLIVSDAYAPSTAAQGERINVTWQVTNQSAVIAGSDWYDYFYLSDDQILDGSDDYITNTWTGDKTPIAGNGGYNATNNITIPTHVKGGNRYLLFVTDGNNYQGETNENNNTKAVPIYIKVPDLIVSDATTSSTTVAPSSTLNLSYTVKNQGESIASQDWSDRIYLSYDAVLDYSDYQLYYRWTSSETPLAVDGSYTVNNISVTLPTDTVGQPGERYLIFVTDRDNYQRETNENNNVRVIPITIAGDNADLEVIGATAPGTVSTQETVSVSWTVKNTGAVNAPSYWYDAVYISSDRTFDANDTVVSSWNSNWSSLNADEEYTLTSNITIPQGENGNQYLLFVADAYNYRGELNETNNVYSLPIEIKTPDLVVTNVTAPTVAYALARMEVVWTVSNEGNGATHAQWNDSVYLSDDNTFSTNDILLKDAAIGNLAPLASGTSYTVSQLLSLPSNITKGNKYLLIVTDNYRNQGELDEANNVKAVAITIGDPDPNLPLLSVNPPVQNQNGTSATKADLMVTGASVPVRAPEASDITVNWTVLNNGSVATNGNAWYDSVYLSDNTIFDGNDRYMGDIWMYQNLEAGQSYDWSESFKLPERTGIGKWYVLVVTDRYNYRPEDSETNNVYAIPIDITIPDLTIIDGTAPSTAAVGETVSVSMTVQNNGTVSADAYRYESVYISDDAVFDSSDQYVGSLSSSQNEPLEAGANVLISGNITIPKTTLGNRYLLFVTDGGQNQSETNESNNVYSTSITITAPDLEVTSVTSPLALGLGETASVSWTVTNTGNVVAGSNWYDYIYLSDDTVYDYSDQYVSASWIGFAPLLGGSSYSLSADITIPSYVRAGERYLLFVADRDNYQGETNENNNVLAVAVKIKAPDLVVSDATTDATTVAPGSTLNLSYTVKNQGESTATQDWYDYIFLSNDTVYDGSDSQLYYRWTSGETPLAVDSTYTVNNINVTLPNNGVGQPGNRYLLFVTDAYRYQSETNENNNVRVIPITITGNNADLEVTAATAPSTVSTQENVSVSWTVKNTGTLTAPSYWYDAVYISSDNTLDANDTVVSSWNSNSSSLAVNQEYTLTRDITIPTQRTGDQYLLFVADAYNYQGELNKTNNVRALPITVTAPDLVITNATVPVKSYPNSRIEVSWTVKNQGNISALRDWYDSIYLSNDETLNTNEDTQLKQVYTSHLTPLAAGEEYNISQLLTLPSNTPIGSRYLIFVTDSYNYQGETNETNNNLVIPITIGDTDPDLIINAANAPSNAVLGENINVNWTVQNIGTREGTGNWYDTIYLSDDQILDESDVAISDASVADKTPLAVNGTYTISRSITIPNTTIGNRYLLFVADALKRISEIDKTNNVKALAITLTAPDLIVDTASANVNSATLGEVVQVSWTVKNTETATASKTWGDQIYISDDTVLDGSDKFVATFSSATYLPLTGNSSYTQTQNVTIPNSLGIGDKYLLFVTDANDAQGETNNNNNIKAIPFKIQAPNLVVTDITTKTTATWGESINVSWTVNNIGTGTALADWFDYIYLSQNPTLDSGDIYLGNSSAASQSPLDAGTSYTLNRNISIPDVAPGTWYLLIAADNNGNQQAETNENDNRSAVTLEVQAPDLVVTDVTAPSSSINGSIVSVSWTVTNSGNGAALSDWWDDIYLSADETFNSEDFYLGNLWTGDRTPLAPGSTYTVSRNITIPAVASGTWYLLLRGDAYNYQAETNNNNNIKAVAIDIGAPDIELTSATAPAQASVGETIEVGWTVTNVGNLNAPADWYDYIYLSDNNTLDSADIRIDYLSAAAQTPLIKGTSYSKTMNVTLPGAARGNKYLLFVADGDRVQGEENENNNIQAQPISILTPDLTISTATSPTSAILGENIDVSWTVLNLDTGSAVADWYDSVYISNDEVFDSSDTFVADIDTRDKSPLVSGATYTINRRITIPNTTTGNRYLLFIADRTNLQGETNETNNVKAVPIALGLVDLQPTIITELPNNLLSGSKVSLKWSVTNTGSASTTNNWVDRIYLSSDRTLDSTDSLLQERNHTGGLVAGASYTKEVDIDIPIEVSGDRYLLLMTDGGNAVIELGGEHNNAASKLINITLAPYADLAVSNVTFNPGGTIIGNPASATISWAVTNIGTGAGITSKWYDRVIASVDGIVGNSDDVILGEFEYSGGLVKDAFYNQSKTIQLPANFEGKYKLFVATDAPVRDSNGKIIYSVFENGLETNNIASSVNDLLVARKPYADLTVTKVDTETTTALTGRFFKINWEVANNGIAATDSASWYDTVQLARQNSDGTLQLIRSPYYFDRTGILSNQKDKNTYTRSRDVFIPYDLDAGTYYFVVTTGNSNNPYEFIYTDNNTKVSAPITISKGSTPDLYVSRVSTVPNALSGSQIDVTWQVFNSNVLGTGDAGGAWYDYLYLRNITTGSTIGLGTFKQDNGLQPGKFYTRTEQVTLADRLEGTYEVVVETNIVVDRNGNRGVYEEASALNNNTLKSTSNITVSLPTRPDLRVETLNVPTTAVAAGGTASVSFEIKNLSPVEAKGKWTDNVYLSLDGTIDGSDILIGSFNNDSALPEQGKYSHNVTNFVIPKDFREKAYIIVQTDAGNTINEYPQDGNNIKVAEIKITSLPPADLVTSNVIAPLQAFAGSTIKVKYKVSNEGIGETTRSRWTDSVWLTRGLTRPSPVNINGGSQDIQLASFTHTGTLQTVNDYNGTKFYENEVEVTLPTILEAGQWYVTVWADALDDVFEDTQDINANPNDPYELDSNNYSSSNRLDVLLPSAPDLQVTHVNPTLIATGGQPFKVTWKVENKGNVAITSGAWYDTVYITDAPTLETSKVIWNLGSVERRTQLQAFGGSYTGELETSLAPGVSGKYVIVKTNSYGQVWEGSYGNNNTFNAATNVTSTPADFVISNIQTFTPNYSGDPTTIEWTVRNDGAGVWSDTRYWYDEVWISQSSTFDNSARRLGLFAQNLPNGGLASGQSYTQRQTVVLPAGIKDNYYIHVFTNQSIAEPQYSGGVPTSGGDNYWTRVRYTTSAYEDTRNNYNKAVIPVIFREADLDISNITVEPPQPGVNPKSGETIKVTWQVSNIGDRDTREREWFDRVYLSLGDNSLDSKDLFLGEYKRTTGLQKGDSYTQTQQFVLPDNISGNYKVIVFTDSNYTYAPYRDDNLNFEWYLNREFARVPEFDKEDNNQDFVDLIIDSTISPDLQVTALKTQETGIAGQKLNVEYTVTNVSVGTTPPRQGNWTDLVYLSRDQKLDLVADRYLGYISHTGGLDANGSYTKTQTFDLPIDLDGSYYVFVVTDPQTNSARGVVYEGSNEGNNSLYSDKPLIIRRPDPVDLEVDTLTNTITVPSNSKVGETLNNIKWTVKNNSAYSITGEWSDAVYLSKDGTWDIGDRLVGRKIFRGTLAGNNVTDGSNSYSLELNLSDNILLPGVTPGDYRIIVRTDVYNEVYEGVNGGETNNLKASADTFKVNAEEIKLNIAKSTTLRKQQERLFELDITEVGQTIRITTDGTEGTGNEIYIGFGEAPTSTKYTSVSTGAIGSEQSAIISNTRPGKYYILVRGIEGSDAPVTVNAVVLPFSVTDIATDRGGDSRYVTTTITGAQFDDKTFVKLVRPGIGEFLASNIKVIDSTTIKAVFDLTNAPHGLYDVKVSKTSVGQTQEATLPYRYLVERAIETDVTVGLGGPNILAPGETGTYRVSVQSLTNIDTPYVHFSFGIPELGDNPLLEIPYVKFTSNLRGEPDRNPDGKLDDVPWAEIVSDVNLNFSNLSKRSLEATSLSFCSDSFSISNCRILRSISSSSSGLEVISIFSLAAASSTKSMALSGKKRSLM